MTRSERIERWDALERPFITPSLLSCDFGRIAEVLAGLEFAGVQAVHLDVMDGHFVPNLSYGALVAACWREHTEMFFDTHLMMTDPARYVDDFIKAGCDQIIFHIEAVPEPVGLLRAIRSAGCRAALCLNPPTPVESVLPFLDELDSVLVMSVMPGFGGQAFDPTVLSKVRSLHAASPSLRISIDGGIKPDTAAGATAAGVTQLVVGSGMFRADEDYAAALAELVQAARHGLQNPRGGAPGPAKRPPSTA